ncbi:hypothetical protein KIPE111705_38705 [Kibdelosporangium persicum]|uniref:DUF3040 domain-containing protein n=1 Tax=Kibdelosporangium persicum TaxID=2698649 RepID=A0ABX2FBS9_9PSEU|nr:hypothetical protein [Kibdelosporangium persicum]NRN68787.1 hypothetical protein [Kibdelosporangium persicum]
MSDEPQQAKPSSHALQIAQMWAKLPPKHLEAALRALEPELRREHEHRLARMAHVRYMCGLGAGFVIAIGMLTSAVFVGINGQPWLAALFTGPSMLALAKLFVIRRADAADARQITRAQQNALAGAPVEPTPRTPL